MNAKTEMKSWQVFYEDGEKFLKAVVNPGKKRVFIPDIIYNITCMAIEKFFMAFFMYRGTMPDNHTMRDLIQSAERIAPVSAELKENMMFLDKFQDICVLSKYSRKTPGKDDMERILRTGIMAKAFVDGVIKPEGGGYEKNMVT